MGKEKYPLTAAIISSYAYIRNHNNYGSLLQYYALQQYLKKFGIEAYWIRFMFPCIQMYKPFVRKFIYETIHGFRVKNIYNHLKTQLAFRKFMHEKCCVSNKKYTNIIALKNNPPIADLYITGSDQVFGSWLEPNYLTFAPKGKKRIAYAASFGKKNLTKEHQEHIKGWLHTFDSVSVREASGVHICQIMGIKAQHLLDPTLLIDETDYLPAKTEREEKEKYIYCYFINEKNPENLRINDIIDYSKQESAKLKITGIEGPETILPSTYIYQYSPETWLNHYKYATCIFTNTFHGIAFCIIFRKQFCVLIQKGYAAKQNERIYSILALFGLQERILKPEKPIKDVMEKSIDWNSVEEIKRQWRLKSDLFWKNVLGIM